MNAQIKLDIHTPESARELQSLDSIEQALAVAQGYAARDDVARAAPTYRGGLGAARLRHVTEFIEAGLERDLTPFGGFAALDTASAPLNRRP